MGDRQRILARLDTVTGVALWTATYTEEARTNTEAIAMSPLGDRTYIAGDSRPESDSPYDWVVIGYLTP